MAVNPKVPYVMKGKDLKFYREKTCGAMLGPFPLPADAEMMDWLIVKRSLDMEEKWAMAKHKHKDFEEYWYVLEGSGKLHIGDDVFDVEAGDLAITPRGVCHKMVGNITFICAEAMRNVDGKTIGRKMQYEACDEPYRDDPETERAPLGKYIEIEMQQ